MNIQSIYLTLHFAIQPTIMSEITIVFIDLSKTVLVVLNIDLFRSHQNISDFVHIITRHQVNR